MNPLLERIAVVRDEGLPGAPHVRVRGVTIFEHRCPVTFEMDFSDVLRFPPREGPGTIIIRLSVEPTLPLIQAPVQQVLDLLEREPVARSSVDRRAGPRSDSRG